MSLSPSHPTDSVEAVYELREAAVEHGRALAESEIQTTPQARDRLISTTMDLEAKTSAALDECAENSAEAASEALSETA